MRPPDNPSKRYGRESRTLCRILFYAQGLLKHSPGTILGINQQVMVLTYQLGDGLTNMLWPGGGLVCCSLCGVNYGDWIKMAWKTFACMIAAGYILIVIANAIGYGPF